MFKDKEEALKRLEQLLQEEDPEEVSGEEDAVEEMPEEEPVLYHNYANRYGRVSIYNNDTSDADLDKYSDTVYEAKSKTGILVLSAIALALAAGILGVLSWWAVKYL